MKRILVIAPTYCRSDCPTGQIERHFFPSLPSKDYRITILCNKKWDFVIDSENIEIIRVRFNKWIDYACRLMAHTPFRWIGNVPDKEYFCWGKIVVKEALQLATKEPFDVIQSISMPCSAHMVAYDIKKDLNIPWIAQFYDPWSGNPFRITKSQKMKQKDQELERKVLQSADLIIHPCEAMVDFWTKLFGNTIKEKMHVLPFVTEIPSFEEYPHNETKLVISHIGNFSSNRNASVFLKALSILEAEIRNRIVVNFVGSVVESDVLLIKKYGLQDIIKLIGKVSENECHKYYVESDLFLIIDIDCSPNLFYPSKILKYFCYKKPILGLTTEQSVIKDELKKTGNYPFAYNDIEGIAAFLTRAVTDYESILTNDKEYGHRFSTSNVIKEYCKLVDTL